MIARSNGADPASTPEDEAPSDGRQGGVRAADQGPADGGTSFEARKAVKDKKVPPLDDDEKSARSGRLQVIGKGGPVADGGARGWPGGACSLPEKTSSGAGRHSGLHSVSTR